MRSYTTTILGRKANVLGAIHSLKVVSGLAAHALRVDCLARFLFARLAGCPATGCAAVAVRVARPVDAVGDRLLKHERLGRLRLRWCRRLARPGSDASAGES